jgi:Kef-type K+ transport system membrane component KefB
MPLITGYIFVGMLAGPHVLDLIPENEIRNLDFVDKIALAFIAFAAGSKLNVRELGGRFRSVGFVVVGLVVVESVLATVFVYVSASDITFMETMSSNEQFAVALLVGTLLVARSPASAIAIVDELRADGPFTSLFLGVTVVMDVIVILLFSVNALVAQNVFSTDDEGGGKIFGMSILRLAISIIGGALLGYVMPALIWGWERFFRPLNRRKRRIIDGIQVFLFLLVALLVFFLDSYEGALVEPLVLSMVAGFVLANYTNRRRDFIQMLHIVSPVVFVAFFTLTGAALALDTIGRTVVLSILLFLLRLVCIFIGAYFGGRLAGEPEDHNRVAWMAYVTQAGVALGLAKKIHSLYPEWGADFATVIVSVVIINQLLGPPLLRASVRMVNEAGKKIFPNKHVVIFGDDDDSTQVATTLQTAGWNIDLVDSRSFYLQNAPSSPHDDMDDENFRMPHTGSGPSMDVPTLSDDNHTSGSDADDNDSSLVFSESGHAAAGNRSRPASAYHETLRERVARGRRASSGADRVDADNSTNAEATEQDDQKRSPHTHRGLSALSQDSGDMGMIVDTPDNAIDTELVEQCIPEHTKAVVIMLQDAALVSCICMVAPQVAPTARLVVCMHEGPHSMTAEQKTSLLENSNLIIPSTATLIYPSSAPRMLIADAVMSSGSSALSKIRRALEEGNVARPVSPRSARPSVAYPLGGHHADDGANGSRLSIEIDEDEDLLPQSTVPSHDLDAESDTHLSTGEVELAQVPDRRR